MKLLMAFSDHGFGVGGVSFLDGQLRKRQFRFSGELEFACLFAQRQSLFVRLTRRRKIAPVYSNVTQTLQHIGDRVLVVNLLRGGLGLLIRGGRGLQVATLTK